MLETFLGGDRAVIRHCPLQLGLVETGQLALHHLKHLILVFRHFVGLAWWAAQVALK